MDHQPRRPHLRTHVPSARPNRLFQNPTRRGNPFSTTSTHGNLTSQLHIPAEEDRDNDMVERDSTGNYETAAPAMGTKIARAIDNDGGWTGMDGEEEEGTIEHENHVIALYGKRNEHWDGSSLMAEIKAALESSLERKVQSLEADRWMFEGDGRSKS